MSKNSGLTPPERFAIGVIEGSDLFLKVDHRLVAAQVESIRKRFQVPNTTLARFFVSMALGLEQAIMASDDPEVQVQSCKALCAEWQILAAAVTRKERGLPPLGVNGGKGAKPEASAE